MPTAAQRDPRSIVTPDAFQVADHLVGTPLGSPRRRAAALAIDGVVIGLITALTQSFALILGVVAAVFFMRAGFKRTEVRNSVFGRAMRFSVGCLGIFIAVVTAAIWVSVSRAFDDDDGPAAQVTTELDDAASTVFGALGLVRALSDIETLEEAESAGLAAIEMGRAAGLDDAELRDALLALPGNDADWADDWEDRVDALFDDADDAEDMEAAERVRVDDLTDAQALEAFRDALTDDEADPVRLAALRARLTTLVSGDSLAALEEVIRTQADDLDDLRDDYADLRDEYEEATDGGIIGWIRDQLDALGLGFGWAALYMTVFLSWWNGQTVGKRLLGLRVVRLDGEPVNWWIAFERAGGYAAGLATGLLGFAQVWWDANRQAIHDRIVGTVVIREGAQKVADWESAL